MKDALYSVHCFDCKQEYQQNKAPTPVKCGACGSERIGVLSESPDP